MKNKENKPNITRVMPKIIATNIVGVSPMVAPKPGTIALLGSCNMYNGHYRTFLRINNRLKKARLSAFIDAGYPIVTFNSPDRYMSWWTVREWCEKQFGCYGFHRIQMHFIFKNNQDATLFKMTWIE